MMAGDKYTSIRNLIVQLVNSIRMNMYKDKLLFFNMANPMGLDLANDMYSILNVDGILIQNYDNDQYLQMTVNQRTHKKHMDKSHKNRPGKHLQCLRMFSKADSNRQLLISYLYPWSLGRYLRLISLSL